MNTTELIFVGIHGSVVALNRQTGDQVWSTHLKGSDFVNVVVDGGQLYATAQGEVFCLDPATGNGLWHNRLKGFGVGLASVAPGKTSTSNPQTAMAARRQQDAAAAAAATSAVV